MKTRLLLFFFFKFFFLFNGIAQCGIYSTSGAVSVAASNTIVNSYYPGVTNASANSLSIQVGNRDVRGNSTDIIAGDLVMIIQMQGADINSTNTNSYGDGIAAGSASGYLNNINLVAGVYEYNTVFSVITGATTTINLQYPLANNYNVQGYTAATAIRTFQVIWVPRYYNLTIANTANVTVPAWNGSTGGVTVLDAANVMTVNGTVSVAGKGFRGGGAKDFDGATNGNTSGSGPNSLLNTDFRWNSPVSTPANTTGGAKGEGIGGTPAYILATGATATTANTVEGYLGGSMGRGAPANAGGGGTDGRPFNFGFTLSENAYNTGGGGGANGGNGVVDGMGIPTELVLALV